MHREDLDDFEKAEAIIHIFEARLGYGLTSNISKITKDKKILETCKVIGKSPNAIYGYLKPYFDLDYFEKAEAIIHVFKSRGVSNFIGNFYGIFVSFLCHFCVI